MIWKASKLTNTMTSRLQQFVMACVTGVTPSSTAHLNQEK